MRIPATIYTLRSTLLFGIGLGLFVFFFGIIYVPTYGMANDEVLARWYDHQGLCLPVCCAIAMGVVAVSRVILLLCTRRSRLRETDYLWWQLAEVAVTALFLNLFLSLFLHRSYFGALPVLTLIYLSVAIYPYAAYWLLAERIDRDVRLAEAKRTIVQLRNHDEDSAADMLRFADASGVVRLVVSTDSVVYIEASGNYVTLLYLADGRPRRFSLRNTMTAIEQLCDGTSLVRCHRSHYINLHHVRLLRKSADGLLAELDVDGVEPLLVSKSYAAEVTARFSKN